jgi:murein DD-endopeptidase MepM/ murein hydrolase activator NlpD
MKNRDFISENERIKDLMGLQNLEESKELETFPVGGGKYNIGWDEDWDNFNDPIGTANSDYSKTPTGAGADGHPHGHHGIDIFGPRGAAIYAPVDGVVEINRGNGNTVIIHDKDGYSHWLGHLDSITVDDGIMVKAGKKVGTLGDSGNAEGTAPHLHYNVYKTELGFYASENPLSSLKKAINKKADDEIEISDLTPSSFLTKLEKAFDDFIDSEKEDDDELSDKEPEKAKADTEQDMFDILVDKGKSFIKNLLS